jgi:hypothetical protein
MTCGIYKITCLKNGQCYIGQAKDVRVRWDQHIRDLERGRHCCDGLQRDWRKYGINSFALEVIEECPQHELDEAEAYWIQELGDYNEQRPKPKTNQNRRGTYRYDFERGVDTPSFWGQLVGAIVIGGCLYALLRTLYPGFSLGIPRANQPQSSSILDLRASRYIDQSSPQAQEPRPTSEPQANAKFLCNYPANSTRSYTRICRGKEPPAPFSR